MTTTTENNVDNGVTTTSVTQTTNNHTDSLHTDTGNNTQETTM